MHSEAHAYPKTVFQMDLNNEVIPIYLTQSLEQLSASTQAHKIKKKTQPESIQLSLKMPFVCFS